MIVTKSVEITDAKIQFVSLVDKAANQKTFLITKQSDGNAEFSTFGKIIKLDKARHYITGVVYEPMTKDAHDNFMTEAEIEKAAHWFLKNGDKVDIQHSFEEADGIAVVESSVTKADCEIEGEKIAKGTWIMTVEVENDAVWAAVEKGDITGFSMGGMGKYSKEDVDIDKSADKPGVPDKLAKSDAATITTDAPATNTISAAPSEHDASKKGIFKRLGELLGFKVVEKGRVAELYEERAKGTLFWNAFDTLSSVLSHWDHWDNKINYESDEATIREALDDFTQIITDLLTDTEPITKALFDTHPAEEQPVEKKGKKMSSSNYKKLKCIYDSMGEFVNEFEEEPDETEPTDGTVEKGDHDMTREDVQKIVDEAIAKAAITPAANTTPTTEAPASTASVEKTAPTAEDIQAMIDAAIAKAVTAPTPAENVTPAEPAPAPLTSDAVAKMIDSAINSVLKQRGVPTNVDDTHAVEKNDTHYLHGIL